MRLTYLASATVLIEAKGLRILCDPWLDDGEYMGAWAQYPPFDWAANKQHLEDLDYIYVSHIHPDHCSRATMAKLDKSTPVLIHRYDTPYLKARIQGMGFEVIELPHNSPRHLGAGVTINILAADDCDPAICGLAFGCDAVASRRGSAQIDSMCVIADGTHVLVNTNDCPYALARGMLPRIKAHYGHVDLLLTGYSGAGPYPQCFVMDEQDKIEAAVEKKAQFLNQGLAFIRDLKPRFVVPFAGQYTLCGKLSVLDDYRGIPTLHAAASYFHRASHDRTLVMDAGDWIDLQGSVATEGSRCGSMAEERRRAYRDTVLAKRTLDYENDALPTQAELEDLARAAFARFDRRRRAMGIEIMRPLYIAMLDGYDAHLRTDGELTIARNGKAYQHYAPYVRLTVDPRLLVKLLKGPSHAHWNRAEIGSHITFERVPDVYDRGLYRALHHFYA